MRASGYGEVPLENGHPGGGQGAGGHVGRVSGSVQRGLGCAAVDLGESVLQELDGGQDLGGNTEPPREGSAPVKTSTRERKHDLRPLMSNRSRSTAIAVFTKRAGFIRSTHT